MTRSSEQSVQHWGYGVSILSKFLSEDGKTMQVQSNLCCGRPNPNPAYNFNLRSYTLTPLSTEVSTATSPENLATTGDAVPISKSVFQATLTPMIDGNPETFVTDWDNEVKNLSWWGVAWASNRATNSVRFTTGKPADDGGWFLDQPWVEARIDGKWVPVKGQLISPDFDPTPGSNPATYTVSYPTVIASGVRLVGNPGGSHRYTSMAEFTVQHVPAQLLDAGFENTSDFNGAWHFDGQSARGIDTACCARTGERNAWLRTSENLGRQFIYQSVSVEPGTAYDISGYLRVSAGVSTVHVGARWDGGENIASLARTTQEYEYVPYTQRIQIPQGVATIDVALGYSADGGDNWVQVDDVNLSRVP